MAEPERGSDEEFAEWYVWAKREISTDNRVCQGAAQAVAFAGPPVPGWAGAVRGGTDVTPQTQPRYAGFWRRCLALLIDLAIVLLGCFVIGFLIAVLLAIALLSTGGSAPGSDLTVSL